MQKKLLYDNFYIFGTIPNTKYFTMLALTKNKIPAILFASAALVFTACDRNANNTTGEENTTAADTSKQPDERTLKAQSVFYSVPSPIETASLIQKAGAKYDALILNSTKNISKYNTTESKALNLGVYGTDLSISSIFDQTQQSLIYLKATNKLSADLGISGAFDENTLKRVEANMSNRDSLIDIISDAYWNADAYLEENDRPNISSLIVAGGWIEGLYVATELAKKTGNAEIKARIAEQKLSLDNLIGLLESGTWDEAKASVLKELKSLKESYSSLASESVGVNASTDKGVTTLGGTASVNATEEQLNSIYEKIKSIRNNIIK